MGRVSPARDVASFVSNLGYDDLPADSVWLAERAFVDTVGVVFAGSAEPGAGVVAADAMAATTDRDGVARVIGRDFAVDVPEAAFINSTAGHALDYDDSTPAVPAHLSVSAVPSILAIADHTDLTGREAITAYVSGFESAFYLSRPVYPDHYQAGWHATGTMGVFCATAAVASALDLDEPATERAVNVAASMSAGLRENFGSMTKPMHPGHAARAGTTAAILADHGFTAADTALTGELGFYSLYDGETDADFSSLHALGEEWATLSEGVDIKKYPCCHASHAAIAAAESMADDHDVSPGEVAEIHVLGSPSARDILRHEKPTTGLQAKFSMEYAVASGIVHDYVGLHSFRDETVTDPVLQSLVDVTTFEENSDLPYKTHRTEVTITLSDGTRYHEELDGPPGTHERPLPESELEEKFELCVTQVHDEAVAGELYETFRSLRDVESVRSILP